MRPFSFRIIHLATTKTPPSLPRDSLMPTMVQTDLQSNPWWLEHGQACIQIFCTTCLPWSFFLPGTMRPFQKTLIPSTAIPNTQNHLSFKFHVISLITHHSSTYSFIKVEFYQYELVTAHPLSVYHNLLKIHPEFGASKEEIIHTGVSLIDTTICPFYIKI